MARENCFVNTARYATGSLCARSDFCAVCGIWRAAQRFASTRQAEPLPALVKGHCSVIRRRLAGVDPRLQEGKARNLELAAAQVNGLIIAPGETFSFWRTIGNATRRRGYQEGLTISGGQLGRGIGGGCASWRT